jgi:hypothetical protein
MCWSVFLASDRPLKLRPWNPDEPAFSVTAPETRDEPVRSQFKHPHMVVLGSQTQCGCGFLDEDDGPDDPRRAVIRELVSYLEQALSESPELELFVCWEGGEHDEPVHKLQLRPADFDSFKFPVGDDVHGMPGYARIAL